MVIDSRKATILRAIIRDYVRGGHPVASKILRDRYGLEVSPATIRNDMAVLEEMGYIIQPHTSAGRIPTDKGYRWYVDNWPAPGWPRLPARHRQTIDQLLDAPFGRLDEALDQTSQVLSDVAGATAVIVAPPARQNRLRRIELFRRDDGRVTLLLIADTGVVEQGVVELPQKTTDADLNTLAQKLSRELDGVAFDDLAAKLKKRSEGDDRSAIAKEIDRMLGGREAGRIFRGGTSKILSPEKFPDISVAHEVVEALEHASVVASLADAARGAESILVFIGREVPVRQMRVCSVVFSTFGSGEERRGTVGVIGPTRMDYPHTISAVEEIARSLGSLLESLSL
jgi:heat-inducible transcriptional repressor